MGMALLLRRAARQSLSHRIALQPRSRGWSGLVGSGRRRLWRGLLPHRRVRARRCEAPPQAPGAGSMNVKTNTRVVSGIQPTGGLHLGNLLGAILRWVRMQEEAQCLFFLADLHALTVDVTPDELRSNVREMAAALIASGIDPKKSVLFAQSAVPAHSELCWILNGTARMGWLNRMTQWKDKAGKNREGASVALFDYPVLQAADILLYHATHVPVGEDQKQHVELTRDIAIKFNTDFDTDLFVVPEPFIGGGTAARVMSLRDGQAKMSKSDPSEMSRDKSHRQRRRDRPENSKGEDRSRAAARGPRHCSTHGPRRRTSSASTAPSPVKRSARFWRGSPARVWRVQAGAGGRAGCAHLADPRASRGPSPASGRARPHPCRRIGARQRTRGAGACPRQSRRRPDPVAAANLGQHRPHCPNGHRRCRSGSRKSAR